MAGLAEFLDCVLAADAGFMASEIADALWLAEHMEGFQLTAAVAADELTADGPTAAVATGERGTPEPAALPGAVAETLEAAEELIAHPGPVGAGNAPSALALPMPRELRRPLNLQRGLRPLMRTIRSGPAAMLDEEATAELSARAGTVMPALVPADERWLDLALVVDASPSMALWENLVRELRIALSQLGAFRVIRTWRLAVDGGKPLVRAEAAWSTPRAPGELADPTGRQAILLLTDCVAQPWWPKSGPAGDMAMATTVETWAGKGPLAILQPLPQRMWARSALTARTMRLRSPFPGAPNRSLLTDRAAHRTGGRDPDWGRVRRGVPIPVLEIDQQWLASWSRLVSGIKPERLAVAFTGAPAPDHDPGETAQPSPLLDEEEQARWLVSQFMSIASPEAFRLGGLMAAAPLTLPLMRLIQRAMCADERPALLAEVLFSGLLREVTPAGEMTTSFAFRPYVRDILLGTIRRSEAIQVRELIVDALSNGAGPGDRVARIPAVPGTTGTALTTTRDSYGPIDAKVLRRIGGRYAQVVMSTGEDELPDLAPAEPEMAGPQSPRVQEEVPPEEPPAQATAPASDGEGLVLLGGPGSGKTTYLAALSIALMRGPGWRLIAKDDPSADMLTRGVIDLIRHRVFPRATDEITSYHWKLAGEAERVLRAGWRRRLVHQVATTSVDLQVTDATGEIFSRHQPASQASLIEKLVRSSGIIFLFDPTREFEVGDTFEYVLQAVTMLQQRVLGERASAGDRLQHYVAVCLSKFDDDRVYRSAEQMQFVSYDPEDPFGFPRVADSDAREFLRRLCMLAPSGTADLAIRKLEDSFRPERIRYFVTSAIGFRLDRQTRKFDRADRANYVPDQYEPGVFRIRDTVYPVSVAEPLIWLGEQLARPPAWAG
jgi:energy-coupling factor transporter ATP-binding protein EcfA2